MIDPRHTNVISTSQYSRPDVAWNASGDTAFGGGELRYGFVRAIKGYPPPAIQRKLIEDAGCDFFFEENESSRAALKAQRTLLFDLRGDDEIIVYGLSTLAMSTGELVQLLESLYRRGTAVRIVGGEQARVLQFSKSAQDLLTMLVRNEECWSGGPLTRARRRPEGKPLSRFQIDYATALRSQGASMRMISQLFQRSPKELLQLMDRTDSETTNRSHGLMEIVKAPLPDRRGGGGKA